METAYRPVQPEPTQVQTESQSLFTLIPATTALQTVYSATIWIPVRDAAIQLCSTSMEIFHHVLVSVPLAPTTPQDIVSVVPILAAHVLILQLLGNLVVAHVLPISISSMVSV